LDGLIFALKSTLIETGRKASWKSTDTANFRDATTQPCVAHFQCCVFPLDFMSLRNELEMFPYSRRAHRPIRPWSVRGLACRLGRCFCFAEVSTGHPHPVSRSTIGSLECLIIQVF
jgi:hypothetical protein